MNDISKRINDITERMKITGARIRLERERAGWTQGELAERIKNELCIVGPVQSTIVNWETGKVLVPIDRILAMSKLFQCDCGYLLGDYDQRTHNATEICQATGLSEESVQHLTSLTTWGINEYSQAIDLLLYDARIHNRDGKRSYRSILDLLRFFFEYEGTEKKRDLWRNGAITDRDEADNTIDVHAISLDNTIIENAVLAEIEHALISLKRNLTRGPDNG